MMRFFTTAVSFALLALSALGAVIPLHAVERFNGPTTGRFIVKVKDGVSKDSLLAKVGSAVTHNWDILNGFAGANIS
jgi:cerevisin